MRPTRYLLESWVDSSFVMSKPAIVPTAFRSAAAVDFPAGWFWSAPRNWVRKPENSTEDKLPSPSTSSFRVIRVARSWIGLLD